MSISAYLVSLASFSKKPHESDPTSLFCSKQLVFYRLDIY